MTKRVTGWHMTIVFCAFFGVVIAVNVTMAVFASRTFGGTVVDNSYVASQNFNDWLEEADRQEAYGWTETVRRVGSRVEIAAVSPTGPLGGAVIRGEATHPLGGETPVSLAFREIEPGRFRSIEELPNGRWLLRLEITQYDRRKRLLVDLS